MLRRGEEGFSTTCPGCEEGTYEVDLVAGKAGCAAEGCAVPKAESWVGVVVYFEELDRKDDWEQIRRIGLSIIDQQEQASQRKKAQEEEKRAERAEHERAGREAEARRRVQEAQGRERGAAAGRGTESRAAGEGERRRHAAQNEQEWRLLNAHRKEKERLRRRQAKRQAQEARARLKHQHDNACARAAAARAHVLWSELLLGVLAGAAVLMAAHYGVEWLGSPAGPGAEPAVTTTTAEGGDDAGWFGRLAGGAAAAAQLVPWRLHVGLLLGVSSTLTVAFLLSRGRQQRQAFYEDEYLIVCRLDERRGQRLVQVNQKADLSEISKEPLRRFVGAADRAIGAVAGALAWAADVLRMAEWPWPQIALSLVFGVLVGWSVFEYLSFSGKTAASAALSIFVIGLIVLMSIGNR